MKTTTSKDGLGKKKCQRKQEDEMKRGKKDIALIKLVKLR